MFVQLEVLGNPIKEHDAEVAKGERSRESGRFDGDITAISIAEGQGIARCGFEQDGARRVLNQIVSDDVFGHILSFLPYQTSNRFVNKSAAKKVAKIRSKFEKKTWYINSEGKRVSTSDKDSLPFNGRK